MKRRTFLTGAATTTGVVAASSFPTPAISQDKREWRFTTTWPKDLPGLGTGAQYFADQVTRCSGGRLTVKLFGAGELVPWEEAIDAVADGTAEMGHGAPYYWKGKSPATNLIANYPFGMTAQEYNAWYHYGGGAELCDEVYREQLGCKFLPCGNTGVQHPGWCTKKITKLEDFQGLKMRMPGIGGETMKKVGATVVNVLAGEVTEALASGTVDWVEWNNPYGEASLGLWRYAKFYYTPGWHEPGTVLEAFINKDAWDDLPDDLKGIVEQCAHSTTNVMLSEFCARSGPILDNYLNERGVEVVKLSDEIMTEIGNAAGEVIAELLEEDEMSRKIYASMHPFRAEQQIYSDTTERDLFRARDLPYKFPKV